MGNAGKLQNQIVNTSVVIVKTLSQFVQFGKRIKDEFMIKFSKQIAGERFNVMVSSMWSRRPL